MLKTVKKRGAGYPRGVCPAGRRFAMARQIALLETALASWPRRQAPLLEVNCGNGAFLEFLWHCGFDVQATEADRALRVCAQRRQVPALEIHAAADNDLPFDNDEFDWVIVHLKSGEADRIAACANEAARLARRGLMLTFWNSQSIPGLCWRFGHQNSWAETQAAWWTVWRQLEKLDMGHVATHSTLALPVCLWRSQLRLGSGSGRNMLGAWCALRLDIGPGKPATPLPLRLNASLRGVEPVMEYTTERSSSDSKE